MAESKRKNTCILYGDMLEYAKGDNALTDLQLAELFKAYLFYINDEEFIVTDPEVRGIWRMAKSQIDRDNAAYNERCRKAAESIKKRYEQKVAQAAAKATNVYDGIRTYTNVTDKVNDTVTDKDTVNVNENVDVNEKENDTNDNVYVYENENVNDTAISTNVDDIDIDINIKENLDTKVSRKKKETAPAVTDTKAILDNAELEPEVREVLEEWLEYKKERREGYKPTGLKSLCSQIRNNVSTYGVDKVVNIIKLSMASNYVGILWARVDEQPKRKQSVSDEVSNEYLKRWGLA